MEPSNTLSRRGPQRLLAAMDHAISSADGTRLHLEVSGRGATALLFVHGWLGSARWWDAQRDALADAYTVAALDLAGHGASAARPQPSLAGYADDVVAAAAAIAAERVVLIGHSMAGAYVVAAAERVPRAAMVVLVDTLKNLDQVMAPAEVEGMLDLYRRDLRTAVDLLLALVDPSPGCVDPDDRAPLLARAWALLGKFDAPEREERGRSARSVTVTTNGRISRRFRNSEHHFASSGVQSTVGD